MLLPVENEKHLVRDSTSNAILNIDKSALRASRQRRRIMQEKDERLDELSERVRQLEELIYSKFKD